MLPCGEHITIYKMKLHGKNKTDAFKAKYVDARSNVEAWEAEVEAAVWRTPHEMKQRYPSADPVGKMNTIFNIKGNKYRLWALINYEKQMILVKEVGTHVEYEKWKVK